MELSEITRAVAHAEEAAEAARYTREQLRRKTTKGAPDREGQIEVALAGITAAATKTRSLIGRLLWEPVPDEQESALRDVSKRMQYERRQLKKMRRREPAA